MTNGRSCVTVKLLRQNRQEDQPFVMNKITQDMQFRQSLLRYASKYGVTKAAFGTRSIANMCIVGNGGTTEHVGFIGGVDIAKCSHEASVSDCVCGSRQRRGGNPLDFRC